MREPQEVAIPRRGGAAGYERTTRGRHTPQRRQGRGERKTMALQELQKRRKRGIVICFRIMIL